MTPHSILSGCMRTEDFDSFSIFIEKRLLRCMGFKPVHTPAFKAIALSTEVYTKAGQLRIVGFKSHKFYRAKRLISPDKRGRLKLNI